LRMTRKIKYPEIGSKIWVYKKGSKTPDYDRKHWYHYKTDKPFRVTGLLPYMVECIDCEGDEWRFPTCDFCFYPFEEKEIYES